MSVDCLAIARSHLALPQSLAAIMVPAANAAGEYAFVQRGYVPSGWTETTLPDGFEPTTARYSLADDLVVMA